ncbi:hypothetical protein GTA08_BOTSDO13092 [Botryosphaeria dothidea]|uniref:Chromo domain-containing protein n=1 Tax=Botryosphaeria dothidea TaxID=55169 RepID=A0A8H4J1L0_9PEZI|nr:hypothetical protein GTA08_BOTSDO13092 [Botryosphaeria dothidea]
MARPARSASHLPSKLGRRPVAPPAAWYAAPDILDETNTHYLIAWEGDDPATCASFEPPWQPKRNANAALVQGDGREPQDSRKASFPARAIVAECGHQYRVAWAPDP